MTKDELLEVEIKPGQTLGDWLFIHTADHMDMYDIINVSAFRATEWEYANTEDRKDVAERVRDNLRSSGYKNI
jgi:hypothetical protein